MKAWFSRIAVILSTIVGGVAITAGAALAQSTPPPAPDATAAVQNAASQISNGLMDGFTSNLIYIVPLVVAFTVFGYVVTLLRARRKPR